MGNSPTAHLFFGYVLGDAEDEYTPDGEDQATLDAYEEAGSASMFWAGEWKQAGAPVVIGGMHDDERITYVALRSTLREVSWGPEEFTLPVATGNERAELDAAILAEELPLPKGTPKWYLGAEWF